MSVTVLRTARSVRATAFLAVLGMCGWSAAARANGEEGGTGLVRIEQAYSLPAGRPVFGLFTSVFARTADDVPRLFRLTPSATVGLGTGFEASGSVLFEGLEQDEDGDYDRRLDLRRRDLVAKLRWSGPLATTRFRIGLQGVLAVPLGDSERPGGTETPDTKLDPGVTAMVSTNVGAFSFPLRVHGNAGYWWSREDGAFYYRDFPTAVAIPGSEDAGNDVFSAGVGIEMGFRRALVMAELTTEQFQGARTEIAGSENLWMLTTGLRAKLTESIGLTGALSFDLSDDKGRTAFDPGDVFPDAQLRVGLTFGAVHSRESYEERKRAEQSTRRAAAALPPPAAPAEARADSVARSGDTQALTPAWSWPAIEPVRETPAPSAAAPPDAAWDARLQDLESRVRGLEMEARLTELERRLQRLEPAIDTRREPVAPPLPVAPAPEASPPADEVPPPDETPAAASVPAETPDRSGAADAPALPAPDESSARAETSSVRADAPGVALSAPALPRSVVRVDSVAAPALGSAASTAADIAGSVLRAATPDRPAPVVVVGATDPGAATTGVVNPPGPPPEDIAPDLAALLDDYRATRDEWRTADSLRAGEEASGPIGLPAPSIASDSASVVSDAGATLPAPGESRPLDGIESAQALAGEDARATLESLAAALAAAPSARVRLVVRAGAAADSSARALAEQDARSLGEYLIVAGAHVDQVRWQAAEFSPTGSRVTLVREADERR